MTIKETATKETIAAPVAQTIAAPVAQTMDKDKDDVPPKEKEEELGCCAKFAIALGDGMEEQREAEEDFGNRIFRLGKDEDDKKANGKK